MGVLRQNAAVTWQRARPWVIRGVLVLVSLFAARVIINIVGSVDWSAVRDALSSLTAANIVVLAVLLGVRQACNAVPLWKFVPSLTWFRSAENDVAALLLGTVAPPPGDIVIRIAMFKSWTVDPVMGMAGVTLNMLAFYVVRFAMPAVGLALVAWYEYDVDHLGAAALSLLISIAMLVALYLIARGDAFAAWVGRTGGRLAARVRRDVNPDAWSDAVVDFRGKVHTTIRTGLAPSLLALFGMVVADALILLASLRFVGVPTSQLGTVQVLAAFFLVYPLTMLPLFGFGVLDAALVAAFVEIAGDAVEPQAVAALIIWRVVTLGIPLLLGIVSVTWWRRRSQRVTASTA